MYKLFSPLLSIGLLSLLQACGSGSSESNTTHTATAPEGDDYSPVATALLNLPTEMLQLTEAERQQLLAGETIGDLLTQEITTQQDDYLKITRGGEGDYGIVELRLWEHSGQPEPVVAVHMANVAYGEDEEYMETYLFKLLRNRNGKSYDMKGELLDKTTRDYLEAVQGLALSLEARPGEIFLTGTQESLVWKADRFELQGGATVTLRRQVQIPDTRVTRNILSGPGLDADMLPIWVENFERAAEEGGEYSLEAMKSWYPAKQLEDIPGAWYANEAEDITIELHATQAYGTDRLFWFSMPYTLEADHGRLHVIRHSTGHKWVDEIYWMEGQLGGNAVHSLNTETTLSPNGIALFVEQSTFLPHLMIWDEAFSDMDMGTRSVTEQTLQFRVTEGSEIALATNESNNRIEIKANASLVESIKEAGSIASELAKVEAKSDASEEHKKRVIWELYKAQYDALGIAPPLPTTPDAQSWVDEWVATRSGETGGTIAIKAMTEQAGWLNYQLVEENGSKSLTYHLIFNTINPVRIYGDDLDDLVSFFDAKGSNYLSIIAGSLEATPDFNGDSKADWLRKELSNFRNEVNKAQELLYRSPYGELIRTELHANGSFEAGVCEGLVGTDQNLSVSDDGLVTLTTQKGQTSGEGCKGYALSESKITFRWNAEQQAFVSQNSSGPPAGL